MGANQVARPVTRIGRAGQLLLAVFLGAVPAVLPVGAVLDAGGFSAPPLVAATLVAAAWVIVTHTFGRVVVDRVIRQGGMPDVLLRMAGTEKNRSETAIKVEGSSNECLFACRMTMGPGWFVWNGAS